MSTRAQFRTVTDTYTTYAVVRSLLQAKPLYRYSSALAEITNLNTATVGTILRRLQRLGWLRAYRTQDGLEGTWVVHYSFTPTGRRAAQQYLARSRYRHRP